MSRQKRLLLGFTTVFALALAGCNGKTETQAPSRPVLVEHPQPLGGSASTEAFPGSVEAREEANLGFRVPGKILSRRVQAGQTVQAGDVLATLDVQDAQLNLKAAESASVAALADRDLAKAELTRHKDLLDKGFISKSLYDVRENTLRLAQARYEQAQSNLAVVKNQTRYNTLTADKAGLITAVLAEAGQVVSAGQPVLRFAAGTQREVMIDVPEGRLDILRKAPALAVQLWAVPGKFYKAQLREVNLQADRSTRTHEARVTIVDADDKVELGMSATVIAGDPNAGTQFAVPMGAVSGQGETHVWIVNKGVLARTPVQVVRYTERAAIVTGALQPDQWIVCAGVHLLNDGEAVRTVERKREHTVGAQGS